MPKPLLTDEIIEQARRDELNEEDYRVAEEVVHIYRSRRIEQEKRKAFRRKLNLILLVVLLLLLVLIYAIFKW